MSNYFEALNLDFPETTELDRQRNNILKATPWHPEPTTNVPYTSANRLLIIGNISKAREIERSLPEKMLCYIACPADHNGESTTANAYNVSDFKVSGYLGHFEFLLKSGNTNNTENPDSDDTNLAHLFNIPSGLFDQILDCGQSPSIGAAIKPPGYYYPGHNQETIALTVEQIPELIGEFEKPKYFQYDSSICAHGRSGISGCRRCIDACPTEAIISIGESIEVNPHLCQGGGTCSSVCPTGAIEYTYPRATDQIEALRFIIKSMREQTGNKGIDLLIFDSEEGYQNVSGQLDHLNSATIPFLVEEIGSVGLDLISSALAYGANRVFLLSPDSTPNQVKNSIAANIALITRVLEKTESNNYAVTQIENLSDIPKLETDFRIDNVATFAAIGDKRNTIRTALGHFNSLSDSPAAHIDLPEGSLFGQIIIDSESCTLCMGCVSQCPGKALQAGGESPALRFIEANCVQCGICAQSCPESVISLQPRIHFDYSVISKPQTLKEEAPFLCISCGKAFATRAMIQKMTEKLKGHWMFDKPEALNRLRMCEDCRVVDMFDKEDHIAMD
jgi:ferredoxin